MKARYLLATVALAACHHATQATTTTPIATTTPAPQPAVTTPPVTPAVTGDQQTSQSLALGGDLIQICGIHVAATIPEPTFGYDQDQLTVDDRNVLQQVATCMTTGPLKGKAVSLTGRADPRGTEEYNLALGSRRASSVSSYLQRLGVEAQRLPQMTRGALDATGSDPVGWAQDRRVDLQLKQS